MRCHLAFAIPLALLTPLAAQSGSSAMLEPAPSPAASADPLRSDWIEELRFAPAVTPADTRAPAIDARLGSGLAFAPLADRDKSYARLQVLVGGGTYEAEVLGSSDDTDANFVRLHFEGVGDGSFGGGLRFEGSVSDDDLAGAFEATEGELFLHATAVFGAEKAIVPVRFGLMLHDTHFEVDATDIKVDWASVGLRVEAEPEFLLVRDTDLEWGLFGRAGGCFGVTVISAEGTLPLIGFVDEDFESAMTGYDLEAGTRLAFEHFELQVSFLLRSLNYDESDPEGGVTIAELDTEFRGLLIGGAIVF
ncbi:MAG: hypothetical protein AB7O97_04760 [Planctomycetota bacterium]